MSGVVLVVGHEAEAIRARVAGRRGVKVVENREYRQGRASSVVAGVREVAMTTPSAIVTERGPASALVVN